jgi:prevent-host-death family protein
MDSYGVEEARNQLGDLIERVRISGEVIGISRYGKPAAVLVPPDWYAEAQDALSAAHSGAS